jgi:uncharacterized protein
MKLDLSEIAATLGKHFHYEINETSLEAEDVSCVEPITGSIDFTNADSHIVVRGSFKTSILMDCSRCLEPTKMPVVVKIEEELPIPSQQAILAGHVDVEEAEEEVLEPFFLHNIFDLSEYIRQAILMEAPLKPLCSEECKGLCPTCGMNLNEGACDCPEDLSASPFAALTDLLETNDEEE